MRAPAVCLAFDDGETCQRVMLCSRASAELEPVHSWGGPPRATAASCPRRMVLARGSKPQRTFLSIDAPRHASIELGMSIDVSIDRSIDALGSGWLDGAQRQRRTLLLERFAAATDLTNPVILHPPLPLNRSHVCRDGRHHLLAPRGADLSAGACVASNG